MEKQIRVSSLTILTHNREGLPTNQQLNYPTHNHEGEATNYPIMSLPLIIVTIITFGKSMKMNSLVNKLA